MSNVSSDRFTPEPGIVLDIEWEEGWVSQTAWVLRRREKSLGFTLGQPTDSPASSLVAVLVLLYDINECLSPRAVGFFNDHIPLCFVINIIVAFKLSLFDQT